MRKWSIGEFNAFFDFALLSLIKVRLALLWFLQHTPSKGQNF